MTVANAHAIKFISLLTNKQETSGMYRDTITVQQSVAKHIQNIVSAELKFLNNQEHQVSLYTDRAFVRMQDG